MWHTGSGDGREIERYAHVIGRIDPPDGDARTGIMSAGGPFSAITGVRDPAPVYIAKELRRAVEELNDAIADLLVELNDRVMRRWRKPAPAV